MGRFAVGERVRRAWLPLLLVLAGCGKSEPLFPRQSDAGIKETSDAGPSDGGSIDFGDGGEVIYDGDYDAGFPIEVCTPGFGSCPDGFFCSDQGICTLNGAGGDLQITLRWVHDPRLPEDLDLHVVEPTPHGPCEIYYGNLGGDPTTTLGCNTVGALDLDANAACPEPPSTGLGEDTENVIYPAGQPAPSGHYIVRVDYWKRCDTAEAVPFTVAVRHGSVTAVYSGTFSGPGDEGGEGAGIDVAQFDIP